MKIALTIAGSDPTGGAGIQSDLRVFRHFSVYGLSAVSALTAQNTFRVSAISAVEEDFLEEQLHAVLDDIMPDAVKTGMLFSRAAVRVVTRVMRGYGLRNIVIDPVTISSTGTSLLENGALDIVKEELLPLAKVITPNVAEASSLSGIRIANEEDMERAAGELKQLGVETVVITGGDFFAPEEQKTLELVYDGTEYRRIYGKRTPGEYHGTGCAFSAAIAALLAHGTPVPEAVGKAKDFIDTAIANAHTLGKGMKLLSF
ncbi:MAG TPA: bifunctional hydroxymethylpyrimidine kinase/phosphomethylpyrimidine kinase [Dissulfurispiraceae bacterium]